MATARDDDDDNGDRGVRVRRERDIDAADALSPSEESAWRALLPASGWPERGR